MSVTQSIKGPKVLKFIKVDGEDLLKNSGPLKIQNLKMMVDSKKKKLIVEIDNTIFHEKDFKKVPSVNISDICVYNCGDAFIF